MPDRKKNKLTLENFETHLTTVVLEKGHDYFENGAVTDLTSESVGVWNAVVTGSEDYQVEIVFSGEFISSCSCDCPHEAEFCKHIVATLYAIWEYSQDITGKTTKDSSIFKKNANKKDIAGIVNDLSETELRQFVIEYGENNPDFRDLLRIHFSHPDKTNGRTIYSGLIRKAADNAGGRGRFIDYYNGGNFVRKIDKLLAKASSALRIKHYVVAADIAFAVIENVHEILKDTDDSGGGIGGCIRDGFEILMRLVVEDLPFDLKERIFKDAAKEAKDSRYEHVGFDDNWLGIVVAATYDQKSENNALELIDTMLASCKNKKDEWYKEYNTQRLIKHKLTLLRKMGRRKEADSLRLEFLHLSDLRIELIEECILKRDYAEAKRLIKEGIEIAVKKKHPGTVDEFKRILLRIAEQEKDIPAFRIVARDLCEGGRHMEYYKALRDTYTKDEWPVIAEAFIKEIQEQNKAGNGIYFNDDSRLADIFTEEKYLDRLLLLLQGSTSLLFIDRYSHLLAAKFPVDILLVYKKAIIEYAEQNTGRNHYITIRERLRKMQTWEGGGKIVKELVVQFTAQYKARKAMIEELGKIIY